MQKVRIVETGNRYGNMNTNPKYFTKDMPQEERKKLFLERRCKAGADYGFNGHYVFMALQDDRKGTTFKITREHIAENPLGWSDISQDILLISSDLPEVVIGHPVADCPVVMMEDRVKGVSAIGHCSADLIDARLPMMIADALAATYGSKDEDILTYVSACAGSNWTYDCWPRWAKDKQLWEEGITEENGIFRIDMRKVIARQLQERNIDLANIEFNMDDTITNPNYYSNSAARYDSTKDGRNFAGLFYPNESYQKTKTR